MRKLLYVPIFHAEADLGSLGPALARESINACGEAGWARHQEVVANFWRSIADFLLSLDAAPLRIYQDGLAVEGEAAARLVEEAARGGSPNFQLLRQLAHSGVVLRKTEEPALLFEERASLLDALRLGVTEPRGGGQGESAETSRRQREGLIAARDRAIAAAINGTLEQGEVGVLFLGANHNLFPLLAWDIRVYQVRDQGTVRAYFNALFSADGHGSCHALGHNLTAPIPPALFGRDLPNAQPTGGDEICGDEDQSYGPRA
ncbi:MAG: hypothetical protein HY680_11635 [Chloroflexi bacterium]|nr:hypothetical protein [Chloroflexota bacterium]